MPIEVIQKQRPTTTSKKNQKPVVIKWNPQHIPNKGADMIRNHSIMAAVNDIVQAISGAELISVNIIGKQDTGKTTLAKAVAHLVHSMSEIPFKINILGKKELINLEDTVANLTPTNQIIVFDDASFLGSNATKKEIDMISSVLSTIRHLPGGKDVKIVLIKNFHYTKAIPPFLRQNNFTFISSVDTNEVKNLVDMLGVKYSGLIDQLSNLRTEALISHTFSFTLDKKKNKFKYISKEPFLPYIYSNGRASWIVVAPKREWIQPICSICATSEGLQSQVDVKQWAKEFDEKFPGISKNIVKQALRDLGIDSYSKPYVAARRYFYNGLDLKQFNIEDIAVAYDLKPTITKLRKKPSGVLIE